MHIEELEHPKGWVIQAFCTTELGALWRTDRLVKMATAIAGEIICYKFRLRT